MGRPVEYGPEVAVAARVIHEAAGGIGARRLQPFVGEMASRLVAFGELKIDPATDALLGAQVRQRWSGFWPRTRYPLERDRIV